MNMLPLASDFHLTCTSLVFVHHRFSLFGLSTSYIIPFYQSRKMEKEGITAAAMASGQAPFS